MDAASQPPAPSWRHAVVVVAGLLVLAYALGWWPYATLLHQYPCNKDTIFWTTAFDPAREGWLSAVFLERHYVAYRPIAALTFSMNHVLTGDAPWGIQGVDIGLHIAVGLAVYVLWGALARKATSPWALAAAAVFWSSPLNESVVPFVARRSYSLATFFGLVALAATLRATERPRWAWVAHGALFLSLLSNETAYVLVPVLLMVVASRAPDRVRGAWLAVPTVLLTGLGVALRGLVLGGLGGYKVPLVAVVEEGQRRMEVGATGAQIFGWAWTAGVVPDTPSGDPSFLLAHPVGQGVAVALAAWAAGLSVHKALARDPVPLLLLVWAAGYPLLAVISGNWFLRMAYGMGVPVALWLVWVARDVVRGPGWHRLHLLPLLLLFGARAENATPVRGLDRAPIREQFIATRLIRRSSRVLADIEGPALVWVGMNLRAQHIASTIQWLGRRAPEGVEVRPLTQLLVDETPGRDATIRFDGPHVRPLNDVGWADVPPDPKLKRLRGKRRLQGLQHDQHPTWILDDQVLFPVVLP